MSDPAVLVTTVSDAEKAERIRAELMPVLEQACGIIGAARRDGLIVGFTIGLDEFGRQKVASLTVTKPL